MDKSVDMDVSEVHMPWTDGEIFGKNNGCNTADHGSARWTQNNGHGLSRDTSDEQIIWCDSAAFRKFIAF